MTSLPHQASLELDAPQELPPGCGSTIKLVLCRICVGNPLRRTEEDASNIHKPVAGYNSIYIPGSSVFNDTYVLHDSSFVVPTHVVAYHLDVRTARVECLAWLGLGAAS